MEGKGTLDFSAEGIALTGSERKGQVSKFFLSFSYSEKALLQSF